MPLCGTELSCEGCPLSLDRRSDMLPHELESIGNAIFNLVSNGQPAPMHEKEAKAVLMSLAISTAEYNIEDFRAGFDRQSSKLCK